MWDDFWKNVVTWMTISCKLWVAWWVFSLLPYLPVHIADRIVDFVLGKLGL